MNIAAVQFDIVWEDPPSNFRKVRTLLDSACIEPETLVVLPEMFPTGFSMRVSDPSATYEFLADTARRFRICLAAGVASPDPSGKGRNEAVVMGPDGNRLATYRKIHPFSYARETDHFVPGESIITFPWRGFTVAPFICYDLRFPEIFRVAVRRGANVFLVLANWPKVRDPHWRALLAARAIENQAYVVGVNRCGSDPKHDHAGSSRIIDPKGEILADAESREVVIQGELDLDALLKYRKEFPALADIRAEFLGDAS